MAETTETATSEVAPDTSGESVELDADAPLGDAGKKALDAERRRANAAEKSLKAMQARIDEIEAEKLSKEERAVKERDAAMSELNAAKAEVLRFRVAAKHGITDEDAELFLVGSDEETLTRQAERLTERTKASGNDGLRVPVEGRTSKVPGLNSDDLENALKRKLSIN